LTSDGATSRAHPNPKPFRHAARRKFIKNNVRMNWGAVSDFDIGAPKRIPEAILDKVGRSFFLDLFWI
jgi:hypothetical protein